MHSPLLELDHITCRYHGHTAVQDLSLHVNQGDLFCLLGPSGCGKTTALRAIAGFEAVQLGQIRLRGQAVSSAHVTLPPEQRRIGMVFQDYALFPHLNVAANIGFGLKLRDRRQQQRVVAEMLELVGLAGHGQRYVHELSGGQQQRVALARALAPQPDLILLDEPFSNLDVDMRERLSQEVRQILKARGATGVLVTHDQMEAFAIGDQIGVMHQGRLLQKDTAYNLYHSPASPFVADFIGQGVFLDGVLAAPDRVETELGSVIGDRAYDWAPRSPVKLLLRPDDLVACPNGPLQAEVVQKAFKGAETLYTLRFKSGIELLSLFPSHHDHAIGEQVRVRLALDHMVIFRRDGAACQTRRAA